MDTAFYNIILDGKHIKITNNLNFWVYQSALTQFAFPCRKLFKKCTSNRADNKWMLLISVFGRLCHLVRSYYCWPSVTRDRDQKSKVLHFCFWLYFFQLLFYNIIKVDVVQIQIYSAKSVLLIGKKSCIPIFSFGI